MSSRPQSSAGTRRRIKSPYTPRRTTLNNRTSAHLFYSSDSGASVFMLTSKSFSKRASQRTTFILRRPSYCRGPTSAAKQQIDRSLLKLRQLASHSSNCKV